MRRLLFIQLALVVIASAVVIGLVPIARAETLLSMAPESKQKCITVGDKRVCFDEGSKHKSKKSDDDDDDDDDDGGKGKKGDEAELTECTIQQPGGGGGCKSGFKWVCEKMKSGKKCCGCVPDKNAEPPEARMEDQPCFSYCSTTKCGGATKEVRDACVLGCLASTSCTPH